MSEQFLIGENGKIRNATKKELDYFKSWSDEIQAEQSRIEAETAAKEAARQSAMDKLKKLGLTDDEIAALVP